MHTRLPTQRTLYFVLEQIQLKYISYVACISKQLLNRNRYCDFNINNTSVDQRFVHQRDVSLCVYIMINKKDQRKKKEKEKLEERIYSISRLV